MGLRSLVLLVVGAALVVGVAASLGRFDWAWTGFEPKRLWDWLDLLIVPVVLAAAGVAFSRAQASSQERIAAANRREDALQSYFDKLGELLLHERKPLVTNGDAATRSVARARTITVAKELDGVRRGAVLRFLYEASLILTRIPRRRLEEPVLDLSGADFSEAALDHAVLAEAHLRKVILRGASLRDADLGAADLSGADLTSAQMRFANLAEPNTTARVLLKPMRPDLDKIKPTSGADLGLARLAGADLSHADLCGATLFHTNLQRANLRAAKLCRADVRSADLSHSDLSDADLRGADLQFANLTGAKLDRADLDEAVVSTATKVSQQQLDKARSTEGIVWRNFNADLARILSRGRPGHAPNSTEATEPTDDSEVDSQRARGR